MATSLNVHHVTDITIFHDSRDCGCTLRIHTDDGHVDVDVFLDDSVRGDDASVTMRNMLVKAARSAAELS